MAGIGATLLIAYAIEISTFIRADYVRTPQRESWIGFVVGISVCGLAAIVVSLAMAERAEVGHWIWLDTAALAFSAISLFMLGLVVALLPALYYEWWRAVHIDPSEDE